MVIGNNLNPYEINVSNTAAKDNSVLASLWQVVETHQIDEYLTSLWASVIFISLM